MRFWIPTARWGSVSTEYPPLPKDEWAFGADGWYLELGWFGLMVGFTVARAKS